MKTKRDSHWPYEMGQVVIAKMTDDRKRTIKSTAVIMLTVIVSLWLGLMFARGL